MSSINCVMVLKKSYAKDILEDLIDEIAKQRNLVIKIEDDDIFDTIYNININTKKIDIDIDDEDFLLIAKAAHEKDITINQMVVEILKEQIEKETNEFKKIVPKSKTYFTSKDEKKEEN